MQGVGISGKVGVWIHSFHTLRSQTVAANGATLEKSPVINGVAQGAVLGPLIFLLLMADVDEEVESSKLSSFADHKS